MKRVLLVTDVPFWRRRKGNQQRIAELVAFLAARNALTVFYVGADAPRDGLPGLELVGANPHRGPEALAWRLFRALPARLQQALVSALNRARYQRPLASFRNPALLDRFRSLVEHGGYDALLVEYIWYAYLAEAVDRRHTRTFLDLHDIFHRRVEAFARFGRVPDKTVTREEELAVYRQFDCLLAIQPVELSWLRAELPGQRVLLAMHPVAVAPAAPGSAITAPATPPGGRLRLAYFASFGDVNLDAIEWFLAKVWDESLARDFELRIHGAICASVRTRAPGVVVAGEVADPAEVYRNADVVINPARFGTGLKIKTVEALAHGVPVLTTSVGAEGIDPGPEPVLRVADDAAGLRRELQRLKDPSLRAALARAGREYVARELTPEACFGPLQAEIEGAGSGR